MKSMTKRIAVVLLAGLLAISLTACGRPKNQDPNALTGSITAAGSTALLPLATAAAEQFEAKHALVTVNISGGGSYNGLSQVAAGYVEIGNSDIEPSPEYAQGLVDHKVAVAPFVIITHKDCPVKDVSIEQLAAILRGDITNWEELGGSDLPIMVVSRQQSSGSRATIVKTVLQDQGDITSDAVIQDANGKVREVVSTTPGAIGYVDAPYLDPEKVSTLKIDGVAYSAEAVTSGQWPIYAFGHMYTKGEPSGLTKEFLEFVLSDRFQNQYVEQLGFIPITKMAK